jgi:hypothetical protein
MDSLLFATEEASDPGMKEAPHSGKVSPRSNMRIFFRLQIFDQRGLYVKRVPIVFIEIVAGIAVTSDDMIAIVDSVRPSIYVMNPVSNWPPLSFHQGFLHKFSFTFRSVAFAINTST